MLKTPLHKLHQDLGAKMGEFAGYDMPLFYGEGVIAEHKWVRESAGLFDVSHMGQVSFVGNNVPQFFQKLTPSWFETLPESKAKYTVLMNEQGGIIDDFIVTNMGEEHFFAVINAGCKDKDIAWFEKHLPEDIDMHEHKDRALLALQGPKSETVLSSVLNLDFSALGFMQANEYEHPEFGLLTISRLGYTGEDGFEISVLNQYAPTLWNALLEKEAVKPIGLAARDGLRLEMGYPLYGHELDETTSPIEADLSWVVSKNNTGFIGADRVLKEKEAGVKRKRFGIKLLDRGVAREGTEVFCHEGKKLGVMTSGGHSPILNASVGMAYLDEACQSDTGVYARVRNRNLSARIVDLPFIEARTKSNVKKQVKERSNG